MKRKIFKNIALQVVFILILINILMISCSTIKKSYLKVDKNNISIQYQEKDNSLALKILNLLENNSENIIRDINPVYKEKITVKIFPDLESLNNERKSIGLRSAGVGGGNTIYSKNSIWLVSPNKPGGSISYDTAIVVLHEFTHLVIYSINNIQNMKENILIESICYYEAGQKGGILNAKDHVKWNGHEFLDEEKYDQKTFWNDHFYIGKFIKLNFGINAFNKLIINNFSLENAFNIDNNTFIKYYMEWLNKQRY